MRFAPLLVTAFAGLVLALLSSGAAAQDAAEPSSSGGQRYFVDFRARPTPWPTGHSYLVYWRTDASGAVVEMRYEGLHPAGGVGTWLLGTLIPVPALPNRHDADVREPPNVTYRVELSARQFAQVKAEVAALRRTHRFWHLGFFNCNDYTAQVASSLGLRIPSTKVVSTLFVTALRSMNERSRSKAGRSG